jgi:hypothetical protein
MMKAPSKKFVILALVVLLSAACITLGARRIRDAVSFALLPSADKRVVGEWTNISIGGPVVTTFRADHTWTSIGGCLEPQTPISGWWKVDGADVIYSVDLPAVDGEPPLQPNRVSIEQLIDGDRKARDWLARNTK